MFDVEVGVLHEAVACCSTLALVHPSDMSR